MEGARLLALLRQSMTDFASSTPAHQRSALVCFTNQARWRLFAGWWIYLTRARTILGFLSSLSSALTAGDRVDVGSYRERKRVLNGGYG